jgi:hypothetical protein
MLAVSALAIAAIVVYATRIDLLRTSPPPRPTANHAFASARRPAAPAELWALGDGAAATPAARAVARRIAAAHPARVLYLGDVYERGSPSDFAQHFRRIYGPLLRRMDPTPGNHEWPAHATGYDPFWSSVTHAPTPPWYSLEIGGWRLLSLNSETPGDPAQLRWLRRRLAARAGTCTLAFWHRPRFSAGRHGDQRDVAPLWDLLRGHAAIVLNGHDHDYQRLKPIDGITEVVAGAGGRSHYRVNRGDRRIAFANDREFGALRLRLRPGGARIAFVSARGRALDRSVVRCR